MAPRFLLVGLLAFLVIVPLRGEETLQRGVDFHERTHSESVAHESKLMRFGFMPVIGCSRRASRPTVGLSKVEMTREEQKELVIGVTTSSLISCFASPGLLHEAVPLVPDTDGKRSTSDPAWDDLQVPQEASP